MSKFIAYLGKNIHFIAAAGFAGVVLAAACLYWGTPAWAHSLLPTAKAAVRFACPMHPNVVKANAGACNECGMALRPNGAATAVTADGGACERHTTDACCASSPAAEPHANCDH